MLKVNWTLLAKLDFFLSGYVMICDIVTYFNGWLNLYVTREKPCIQAKKWRVMFVCVNMASENEESHMVMQT
jgi:hypothetical protein